ncbi:choice-of-anchor Q domain-containing protein [Flaviaesturariibacter terrae]
MKPAALLLSLLLLLAASSCRKDRFTGSADAQLRTGADTLHFDTVFVSAGSTSGVVKIFNDNKEGIRISSVHLAGGASSPFHINVDGIPGPEVRDLEVAGGDSLYVFVTVTVNPNAATLPFIVQDSFAVEWNGNRRWVQLDAFGQNAHFLRNHTVRGSETWDNILPYVILDGLTVDTTATLNITQGARVYFHANAPMIVHGRLLASGDRYDSTRVLFTGDRLDAPYRDFPASWPGIIFSRASNNSALSYSTIRNAYQGLVISGPAAISQLTLRQCIIDNAYDAGIYAVNGGIDSRNLLVSNCGAGIALTGGGNYQFVHTTAAGFSNAFQQHKQPVLYLSNADVFGGSAPLNAVLRNGIYWGEANGIVNDEVVVYNRAGSTFNVHFEGALWRVRTAPAGVSAMAVRNNLDPLFDSVDNANRIYSFRLADGSPAIDAGVNSGTPIDLDGKPRPVGTAPDLGAYEKQ